MTVSPLAASLAQTRAVGGSLFLVALPAVHALHVVEEIVTARETLTRGRPFTVRKVAQVGARIVAVHAMGFSLVTKQACNRGEGGVFTLRNFASEWLQVRVDILAIQGQIQFIWRLRGTHS